MKIEDKNIESYENLKSPGELKKELPNKFEEFILETREKIKKILDGKDNRKLIIAGPCSIHNVEEAIEYAKKLKELQEKVKDKFLLVMRTYFEKPRTTIGWKGLVYDPNLDGSNEIENGLEKAREFLLELAEMNVAAGTEFLGPLTPQYLGDLISWTAIGARTTESQPHREMASGLSMPVGFKNSTSGNINLAINSIKSAKNKHSFLGIDNEGKSKIVHTKGNRDCHLILRGGKKKGEYISNYDKESIEKALNSLEKEGLSKSIIVDCSHGNSGKDHRKQPEVFREVLPLMKKDWVKGVMLESYLKEGSQNIDKDKLKYGVSITDDCMGWETTKELILEGYREL